MYPLILLYGGKMKSQGSIELKNKNLYRIDIIRDGKKTGEQLVFNLADVDLTLKYVEAYEKIDKIENNIKMQEVIISKRQDVPGKYISKNTRDLHTLYSKSFKEMREAMDKFLGKGGCQKVFGDTNYIGMYDDLFEALKPELDKMNIKMESFTNRIISKYSMGKDNVI